MSFEAAPIHVAVRNLSKAYAHVQAVSGVGFEIRAGQIFGLLGPNGAGKTTTVESVIGLIEPDSGSIELCGIDVRAFPERAKQKIGVALQSTGLQDKITPREALDLFGSFYRCSGNTEVLLKRFGITAKADAAYETLSGGQKQSVALALAFVNDPQVVLLDEPTAGLDPQMRREFHHHIREMKREGRSVLLTTHDMEEAEQLCDRIIVLHRGRIVAEGSPRDLIAESQTALSIVIETTMLLDEKWFTGLPDVRKITLDGTSAHFTTSNAKRTLAELIALLDARQIEITGLRAGRATLEDVILQMTSAGRELD
jgi:ABC-2 type transport system ATP-binding protein